MKKIALLTLLSVAVLTASGSTLPAGDYDHPETKVASGPTLPPDDYDYPETKLTSR